MDVLVGIVLIVMVLMVHGLRRRVRDAYLGMGIGENLAVIARPA